MEGSQTAKKEPREPKYRELEYAIDGLFTVVRKYHSLIEDMDNGPSPKVEGTPPAPPQHSYIPACL